MAAKRILACRAAEGRLRLKKLHAVQAGSRTTLCGKQVDSFSRKNWRTLYAQHVEARREGYFFCMKCRDAANGS